MCNPSNEGPNILHDYNLFVQLVAKQRQYIWMWNAKGLNCPVHTREQCPTPSWQTVYGISQHYIFLLIPSNVENIV